MGNKMLRAGVFFYTIFMHVLVFLVRNLTISASVTCFRFPVMSLMSVTRIAVAAERRSLMVDDVLCVC